MGRDGEAHVLDAKWKGNVARFFNHSCAPNLRGKAVFVDSHTLPNFAFFALRDIPPGAELTWDYKYDIVEGRERELHCRCGRSKCRGRLL